MNHHLARADRASHTHKIKTNRFLFILRMMGSIEDLPKYIRKRSNSTNDISRCIVAASQVVGKVYLSNSERMTRAKDAKVWNEDLVTALRSREEECRQRFSQRQYLWRDGATAIASIRKDIYQYKTGRIVGLPRTLTKCVEDECRAIIEGRRPLLPEGYVPTTLEERSMSRGTFDAIQRPNPYHNDPYLKRIKMRGGAYAILMAFYFSETKTMTQNQICAAAQHYCDEEMEPNFYAGRSYGAWSSKKTLVKHGLVQERRTTQMGRQGIVRNGVFEYTLTTNGQLFLEALLQKFPQSANDRDHSLIRNENHPFNTRIKSECTTKEESSTRALKVKSENILSHVEKSSVLGCKDGFSKHSKVKKSVQIEDELSLSDSDDDDDVLFFHRHERSITLKKDELEHTKGTEFKKNLQIEDELSLSDSDDDENDLFFQRHKKLITGEKDEPEQTKATVVLPDVIDLVDSSDEESSVSELDIFDQPAKTRRPAEILRSCESVPQEDLPVKVTKKSATLSSKLVILIDNRERNHNATPRHMRIELSRHLSKTSGSLRQVWPSYLPLGDVEEDQLNYGDFAFLLKKEVSECRRLPLTIERKRISDLVQRSYRAHHWQQLHRMRDCCEHAILLIEGNSKKTSNFLSYDDVESTESWNPDHHTIDDEHAFYRFLGRAVLSSPVLKIVQAKDEQACYRSVGAIGLVASCMSWEKNAPKSVPSTKVTLNKLYNKLKSRGIPWQIARRVSEELGSIQQLDKIYNHCEASARPSILVPAIRESCSSMIETENSRSLLEYGTVEGWSSAIHSAWYSKINDPTQVVALSEENKYFANDRAYFLKALHRGKTVERAVHESNISDEVNLRESKRSIRRVRIESTSSFSTIFPTDVETETFYETISVEENPLGLILPSVVMQTIDGAFQSSKLIMCIIEGSDLIRRIQDRVGRQTMDTFTDLSKEIAEELNSESSSFLIFKNDRRVLLLRGLGSAMNEAAKQPNYRAESRVLVDLVMAELMLRYNIVVIQAPSLVNDLEMILREFAMACFYYQLTTQKLR